MKMSIRVSLLGAGLALLLATPALAKNQPLDYDWGEDDVKAGSVDHDWGNFDLDGEGMRFGGKGLPGYYGDGKFDFEPGDFFSDDPKGDKHQLIRRQLVIVQQLLRELRALRLLLHKLKDGKPAKGGDDGGGDVPEPGTGLLIALAIGGGYALRRRRA